MKKSLKVTVAVVGLGLVFGIGGIVGASTDWETNAINGAYSELLETASSTTDELTSNTDADISNKINTAIAGTVEEQQKQLQDLLDQYYQLRLNGLTSTPEYLALEKQIETVKLSVLEAYKLQIDEAFANQN